MTRHHYFGESRTKNHGSQSPSPRQLNYSTKTFWTYTSTGVNINIHTSPHISKLKELQPPLNRTTVWFKLLQIFTKEDITILKSDKNPVINGIRNTSYGLWDVKIETSQTEPRITTTITQHANSVLCLDKTRSELSSYLHAAIDCLRSQH